MKLPFREAYHNFIKSIRVGKLNVEDFDLESILESAAKEYLKVEILGLDQDNDDRDMLIIEYGDYDWNGEGNKFEISFKRQLIFEDLDEFGYYGFTILYDKTLVSNIGRYSDWCANKEEVGNWIGRFKRTEGFQKLLNKPAVKISVVLEKPH